MTTFFLGEASGFISFHSEEMSLSMNLYGRQSTDKDFDIRLSAGSPFWLSFQGEEILPSFAKYNPKITSAGTKMPLASSIGYILDALRERKYYSPHNVGYVPYLQKNSSTYCFTGSNGFSYKKLGADELRIEFEGSVKKFDIGFIDVLIKSINWVFNTWVDPKKAMNRNYLITDTPFVFKRKMLLSRNSLYFEDSFFNLYELNPFDVRFPFRTRVDFNNSIVQDEFFIINSLESKVSLCIQRHKGEEIILKTRLNSSTGISNHWEILTGHKADVASLGRLVMLCDEVKLSAIEKNFHFRLNQVQK